MGSAQPHTAGTGEGGGIREHRSVVLASLWVWGQLPVARVTQ